MLEELKTATKIVGVKQLRKALANRAVKTVYVAADADPQLIEPIVAQCEEANISVVRVESMETLGAACEISVSAAAAAII